MRTKSLITLLALIVLAAGLALSLSGCSGGESQPSSVPDPLVADTVDPAVGEPEAIAVTPDVEETPPLVAETPISEVDEPATEPVIEDPAEQPVLSWARDAGGLSHCDRLSVYADGRVEAVVCRATTINPTVYSTLSEEQLAQVLAWAAEYALFTRRESEMTNAVRTTNLHGSGETVPALEAKVEIATFAAEIFFSVTEPE